MYVRHFHPYYSFKLYLNLHLMIKPRNILPLVGRILPLVPIGRASFCPRNYRTFWNNASFLLLMLFLVLDFICWTGWTKTFNFLTVIILCYMTVTKRFWMTFKPTQQQTKTKKPFIFLYNLFANHAHLALLQVKFKLKSSHKMCC